MNKHLTRSGAFVFASLAAFALFAVAAAADDAVPSDAQPRWWKGNLHTHTFWSDGDDFPEMVAEWYRTHDYNFLALSDHNVLSQGIRWQKQSVVIKKAGTAADVMGKYTARFGDAWVETRGEGTDAEVRLKPLDEFRALLEERGKFIMIPGEEISDKAEGGPVHMGATNLQEVIPPVGGASVQEAIMNNMRAVHDQAERAGREILAHLNHPNYHYAVTAHDLAHAVLERHFEVYNGHPGVDNLGDENHIGTERMWDIANTIRLVELKAAPLFGIATDDSHNYHGKPKASHPGRGWVMVRSTHLTPEYIVRAIKAGDCYASSGVTLRDVRYDAASKTLRLEIEPAGDAEFTVQFIGTLKGVDLSSTEPGPLKPTAAKPAVAKSGEAKSADAKQTAKPVGRRSRNYSEQIGKVLKTSQGLTAEYRLTGEELYVRAVVTSTEAPVDPSFEGQRRQAWTQPVGWELPASAKK